LTTTSQSSDAATSARRSVPVSYRLGQPDFAAEALTRRDAQIVGRDDDRTRRGTIYAPIHVLDHRTASRSARTFPGSASKRIGRDDGDDSERRNRIDS
jgi:hypothetical protein